MQICCEAIHTFPATAEERRSEVLKVAMSRQTVRWYAYTQQLEREQEVSRQPCSINCEIRFRGHSSSPLLATQTSH